MSGGAIPTPCPSCGLKLSLAPEHHGKEVHCPECGTLFVSGTNQVIKQGALDAGPAPAPVPSSQTKRCPYCAEDILADAKKCKYCSEWLAEGEEPPKTSRMEGPDPRAVQKLQSQGTTAFVLSLIGLIGGLACVPIGVLTIVGLIMGATANSGLRKIGQPYSGMATAAIIIGVISVVLVAAVFLIFFVASMETPMLYDQY
jgi:predicted RNA-binding Zn-ribbon protein involved in translation (DUF1610 family)